MFKNRVIVIILFMVCLTAAAAPGIYFYRQYQGLKQSVQGVTEDPAMYVTKVSRHILLPQGETPTVLTVTDKERLSGQEFFSHAKNGDKVLVYPDAKKAFLYDPDADKVIEVGPVNYAATESAQAVTTTQPTPTPAPITFVLYNGTTVVGLTKTFEATLKSDVPGATVLDRDNAAKQDYETSILVDLKGDNAAQAETLGTSLGLTVASLPAGETKPKDADFLIILGADKK